MPARKADIKIAIEANGRRFNLNCERMIDGSYKVKRGRNVSKRMPYATLTQIFNEARKWAVKQGNE
jgi:hypothetical protein